MQRPLKPPAVGQKVKSSLPVIVDFMCILKFHRNLASRLAEPTPAGPVLVSTKFAPILQHLCSFIKKETYYLRGQDSENQQ